MYELYLDICEKSICLYHLSRINSLEYEIEDHLNISLEKATRNIIIIGNSLKINRRFFADKRIARARRANCPAPNFWSGEAVVSQALTTESLRAG